MKTYPSNQLVVKVELEVRSVLCDDIQHLDDLPGNLRAAVVSLKNCISPVSAARRLMQCLSLPTIL